LLDQTRLAAWARGIWLDNLRGSPWGSPTLRDTATRAAWLTNAKHILSLAVSPWGIATPTDRPAVSPWGQYTLRHARATASPWGVSTPTDRAAASPWGMYANRLSSIIAALAPPSRAADSAYRSPWGRYTRKVSIDVSSPTETGEARVTIPLLRSYIVINAVTLTRVSDNLELPATALQLSIDADSWVWGFTANLAGAALDDVVGNPGAPVELAATVNGTEFRLLAERVARTRSFGKAGVSISGRGIAAVLDAPYAALASHYSADAVTAQQAAEAAITAIGLPTGWSIDWQITDWLLPAGLWSHQGSPISAVNRIAHAAGAYVQSNAQTKTLHILPRYPTTPWDWATTTPDYAIPTGIATTEGIQWTDKPAYDVVYISGEAGGILARVKRTGEAGILPAPMITDAVFSVMKHQPTATLSSRPSGSDVAPSASLGPDVLPNNCRIARRERYSDPIYRDRHTQHAGVHCCRVGMTYSRPNEFRLARFFSS
jgi:hypothetical protein